MNKQEKKELVPALRFPEFRDKGAWESELFEEIYSFKTTNSLSRDKLNYEQGAVKNIHYGDIHTKFSTLFDIEKEVVPYINPTESLETIKPESFCVEGDMIFADASEDMDDIGKCIEIVSLNNQRLVSGLHTLLARQIKKKLIIGFGGYLFKSNRIREQIKKEAQGTKVLGISARRLSSIDVAYPADEKEQEKIADCLTSIDGLITTQTQKLSALKAHKKCLMHKLFPAEGETLPKLRFPEFRDKGEWEEKSLEDVAPLQRGFDLPTYQLELGNIPVVYSNGVQNYHKEGMAKGPGLVTGRSGTIGKLNYIEAGDYWPHNTTLWVTSFKGNIPKFIYFLYAAIGMERFASGSGVPTLNRNYVHAFHAYIPKLKEEQQKIADCLTSIDNLITAQTQEVEVLKAHKKGLMQQLFPVLDEVGE